MDLRTVILLSIGATVTRGASLGGSCCEEKTVGGVKYKKSGEEDTSSFNCLNNCVYEKVDSPGSKYCFKEGDLTVECGKGGIEECTSENCKDATKRLKYSMNTTINPCDDFYEFVCGGLLEKEPYVDGHTTAGPNKEMVINTIRILFGIFEDKGTSGEPDIFKSVRNYYNNCKENQDNVDDLKVMIKTIGGFPAISSSNWNEENFQWTDMVIKTTKEGIAPNKVGILPLRIDVRLENASKRIIVVQGFDGFPKSILNPIEKNYLNYLVSMCVLLGADESVAKTDMQDSINFEKKLGEIMTDSENSKPKFITLKEASELFPGFNLAAYIEGALGIQSLDENEIIQINDAGYLQKLGSILKDTQKKTLANYLGIKAVDSIMKYVSPEAAKMKNTWGQNIGESTVRPNGPGACTMETANLNGPGNKYQSEADVTAAVASMFVRKSFSKETKKAAVELVMGVKAEFREMLKELQWMDPETKNSALKKEANMGVFVGYVDELLDDDIMNEYYSNLNLLDKSYLKNVLAIQKFNREYFASEYPKKRDIKDWRFNTVTHVGENAWYQKTLNAFTQPAANFYPPTYALDLPLAWNYGNKGTFAGHEISHGFDSSGKDFDANGNKKGWWKPEAEAEFDKRAKCLVDLYNNYTEKFNGTIFENDGKKTLAENIADYGGIKAAYRAYKKAVGKTPDKRLPGLDYSPNQLFWIGNAYGNCIKYKTVDAWKSQVKNDAHSPFSVRVRGMFSGMPEFAEDWNCPTGSQMNPANRCTIY